MKRFVLATLAIFVVCLVLTKLFVVELVSVQGVDMAPTLQPHDLLLVNVLSREPRRGDIVLFRKPSAQQLLMRRVVALPGEQIAVKDEVPALNGVLAHREILGEVTLGAGGLSSNKRQREMRLVAEHLAGARFHVLKDPSRRSKNTATVRLGNNAYYVLSDNRNHGSDSRDFGAIDGSAIEGVVTYRLSSGPPAITPFGPRPNFASLRAPPR